MPIINGRNPIVTAHSTLIGKIIHFTGRNRKTNQIISESGVCVKMVIGRRRGPIYHTASGFRVPEHMITHVEDTIAAAKATNAFFQKQNETKIAMHQLMGHIIEFDSRKRGHIMGRVTNVGKKRVTIETHEGTSWKVPPSMISKVDGSPYKM